MSLRHSISFLCNHLFRAVSSPDNTIGARITSAWASIEEPKDRYTPGGYHPIGIGDTLFNRYTVLKKLGYGGFATVWLSEDTQTGDQVAIKICSAESTAPKDRRGAQAEVEMLERLRSDSSGHAGQSHIIPLLNHFTLDGPNGTHLCMVLEAMGPDVFQLAKMNDQHLPLPLVRHVIQQVLLGLDFLHQRGRIIHTDVKPNNIMFDISANDVEHIYDPCLLTTPVKLGDLGAALRLDEPFPMYAQAPALRAPELVIRSSWGTAADIWGLGCIAYELLSAGEPLFSPKGVTLPTESWTPLERHVAQISHMFGPFPAGFVASGVISEKVFDAKGNMLRKDVYSASLESLLSRFVREDELGDVVAFLQAVMVIDPAQRPSAAELLQHPWFR